MLRVALLLLIVCLAGCSPEIGVDSMDVEERVAYPFVLVHGLGLDGSSWESTGIAPALRAGGHRVFTPTLPLYAPPREAARTLAQAIDQALQKTGATRVHLIAQSMGGLVARAAVSELGYGDRVASITTVGTPHRGTNLADTVLFLWKLPYRDGLLDLCEKALNLPPDIDRNMVRRTLEELSEGRAAEMNALHPDDERVFYQSYAAITGAFGRLPSDSLTACDGITGDWQRGNVSTALEVALAFVVGHGFANDPNDSYVTVASAHRGTFRGCVGASHAETAGYESGADARTGFEVRKFYRGIADELDREIN